MGRSLLLAFALLTSLVPLASAEADPIDVSSCASDIGDCMPVRICDGKVRFEECGVMAILCPILHGSPKYWCLIEEGWSCQLRYRECVRSHAPWLDEVPLP